MINAEPNVNEWLEYKKPKMIEEIISDICAEIIKKGSRTAYQDVFDALYELIEEDLEAYRN